MVTERNLLKKQFPIQPAQKHITSMISYREKYLATTITNSTGTETQNLAERLQSASVESLVNISLILLINSLLVVIRNMVSLLNRDSIINDVATIIHSDTWPILLSSSTTEISITGIEFNSDLNFGLMTNSCGEGTLNWLT